ncbi:uncharacterized protein LOC106514926 [Austrofundulus limnaeus]|uniref:Uncharacterized protein LOC106514926 n=1 Tax=Austrofundulus limnaeus TaxID=52670 RepID=A0A2I4AWP8_AUSLI|nr:PREDICTED: uncharacterized protein LOC106514926 [Austrofundulus limnaeus]
MGNMHCPAEDAAHLAAVARDICPFPSYNYSPHFVHMMSINSSRNLHEHYTAVQRSLTPKQLEDFTQSLRTTFGREGKVTLGGVGVVALSLAVLFDTLAKQVRGEVVSDAGPIPGLFVKDPRGYYPPQVDTISKYLRLVPHIANNPDRMKQETARFLYQLKADEEDLNQPGKNNSVPLHEDVTLINRMLGFFFTVGLKIHLQRISNVTLDYDVTLDNKNSKSLDSTVTFNLNCDTEAAEKDFLAKVESSENLTKQAFEACKPKDSAWFLFLIDPRDRRSMPLLRHVAKLEFVDVMLFPMFSFGNNDRDDFVRQRDNFDLKVHALGKWP